MSFYTEMMEQPTAAKRLLEAFATPEYRAQIDVLKAMMRSAEPVRFVFAGMGSSTYASYIACSILRRAGIQAYTFEARELAAFDGPVIDEHTILFGVSQSGNSLETVALCEKYKDFPNLAVITNLKTSNLYRYGRAKFHLEAGEEKHTATKSYTNTVLAILYIAYEIAGMDVQAMLAQADKLIGEMERLLAMPADAMTDFWQGSAFTALIGSGVSYCTASHASLVLMEAAHVNAAHYTVGQFIHGPIEIINGEFCSIIFDFEPAVRDQLDRVIDYTLKFGGRVLLFTQRKDMPARERMMTIEIDCENGLLAPLAEILPIETLTLEIGRRAGLCPGDLYRVHK